MVWVSEQNENDKRLRCCCSTCNSSSITLIISISPKKISTTVLLSQLTMPSASSQKQIPLRHCVVSSLSHSKVQGSSMYSDEPIFQITHHHQQPQSLPPLQVATSLWPSQTSNYWFPNWRELFHGFIVVPSSQPRHATVSSFAQNQAVACTPYSPSSSCTQFLHLGTNDPTQFAHHGARSAQHQQITSPLPSSSAHAPLSRFHDVAWLPRPSGEESHTGAQSPTPVDQTQKRDEYVACPPSSQALGPITKYTIKSPFWLPQGWVTEMRMRSTGTAADKFYKHLASGRRFRSRNEVLHFIHTGKGRTRKKQGRRKKFLNLSLMNNFAQKKHTAFAASKLVSSQSLPSSSSENRHPIHVGNLLLTEPRAEMSPNGETGPPTKQHICFSSNSGIQEPESLQLQLIKRPAQDETQKLPVKKQKPLPLKAGDDKQTSNLWQWFQRPDTEAKASKMAEQRNENDLSSKDTASQKTEQLGREIQAAHQTVVQMSKEMQATVEKLSREIREAQKDVELGGDLKLPRVPAEMQVASTYKADAGKICRDTPATPRECMMSGGVVQASHWLPIAANSQTGQPESIVGFVSHNVQKQDNLKGFPKQEDPRLNVSPQTTNFVLNALSAERSLVTDSMNQAIQPAIWPDITSHQVTQMDYGSQAAKRHAVDTSNQATQPAETAFVTTVDGTQAARLHAAATIHVTRATVGDVTLPTLWPGFSAMHVAQPTQIANIAHTRAAEKCGLVEGRLPQCAETVHFEASNRTQTPQRHVDMGCSHHAAKQPAQVDCIGIADIAQAVRTQMAAAGPLLPTTERLVYSIGNADTPLYNLAVANAPGNVVAGDGRSEQWQVAQASVSCEMATTEEVWRQKYQDIKERSIRRNKFAAVLNPKLDLSRLNPALTARQKAKVVQRMKTRHARELLATLGLHLCRKAIRRKPWPSCTSRDEI